MIDWGIDVRFSRHDFTLKYGSGVTGPEVEIRTLDSIRSSLRNPQASGPDKLYAIGMDVFKDEDKSLLVESKLLLGVVAYNGGMIGNELVRSQGHVHRISSHSGWSPPEIFEVWQGTAIIYMQEKGGGNPGKCYAVTAESGDWVVVPPGWPHMAVNGRVDEPMVFGAICDRGYEGFDYDGVRARGGLAFFPVVEDDGEVVWRKNPSYSGGLLIEKRPSKYAELFDGVPTLQKPLYVTAVNQPALFSFVPSPGKAQSIWLDFVP